MQHLKLKQELNKASNKQQATSQQGQIESNKQANSKTASLSFFPIETSH